MNIRHHSPCPSPPPRQPLPPLSAPAQWRPPHPPCAPRPGRCPPNYRVTAAKPSPAELGNIVTFLVATNASDQAKAANVEGGMNAVVVPKTVCRLGLFRPPLGVQLRLHRTSAARQQRHRNH